MSAPTAQERAVHTGQVVREDLIDFVRGVAKRERPELTAEQDWALAAIRRDGFAVIPDYCDRDRALAMKDKVEAYLKPGTDQDYDEGAWLRFWDDRSYDQGVRRLYHIDKLIPELSQFRFDPFIFDIVKAYYRQPFHSGMLIFQHNTQSNANTRYFHVDAFSREFKAFLYLEDVDMGNGPFTYIRGTHRAHVRRLAKQLQGNENGSPTSFHENDVSSLLGKEVKLTAPAGTLILADVRGLHRGSPQIDRSRSVLVNYIVKHQGDLELDR
jgi:Phytanoyl-CoA dioxygenase (PhyH)